MINIDNSNYELVESDEVFTFKNENTTLGFVRFNDKGEVEYIFVNPIFRKQGLAKKLLKLVKEKTGREIILQQPISPLGHKLLNSINKKIIVMHPGPINRGVEITSEVADSDQAIILDQVENGVAIRMAIMYLLAAKLK